MFGQPSGRRSIYRSVPASPHQKRRNIFQLWQRGLQLLQILRPCADNTQPVFEQSRLRQGRHVAVERTRRNVAAVGIKTAVRVAEQEGHARDGEAEQGGAKTAGEKWRHASPVGG